MKSHDLKGTLPAPPKPNELPDTAQWLAGEGAGSWFVIAKTRKKSYFNISRFSQSGKLECTGIFTQDHHVNVFDIEDPYQFTYLSHCAEVHIRQNNDVFKFIRFSDV